MFVFNRLKNTDIWLVVPGHLTAESQGSTSPAPQDLLPVVVDVMKPAVSTFTQLLHKFLRF